MSGSRRGAGAYVLLAVGVVSVGAAAVLVRLADTPALALSFWRTLIGGAVLASVVGATGRRLPQGPHRRRALIAGALLGLHFWLWLRSLELTSVMASVVLVCMQPVFVAVLGALVLHERTPRTAMLGILVALAGTVAIALDAGAASGAQPLVGDALALAGAAAIAGYVLVGRRSAGEVDVLGYSAMVSLAAAAMLGAPLLLSGTWVPPSPASWGWTLALALGPQVVGHTALNAALARLPAAVVSGSILGEPLIATLLAWMVLDEQPGVLTVVGSVFVLGGLTLLVRRPASVEDTRGRSVNP